MAEDPLELNPSERALELLRAFLTEAQQYELSRFDGFRHYKGDRLYWISLRAAPACAFLKRGFYQRYCIHTIDRMIPSADEALTFLTWIENDPDRFHKWANVIRTSPLPAFEGDDELCVFLATRAGGMGTGGSPYATFLPATYEAPLTPEQRSYGLAQARNLKKVLRVAMLRDRLALVDLGDQPILNRLAEEWPFEEKRASRPASQRITRM